MANTLHPIWNQSFIQSQGVIVTEVDNMPTSTLPFRSDALVISLNLSGSATFDYNMEQRTTLPKELAVTLPNIVFSYCTVTPDYRATLVIVSKEYFDKLIHHTSFMDYKKYYYHPGCDLNDEQYDRIKAIIHVLRLVSESDHPKRPEFLEGMLDLLFYTITRYRGEEGKKSESQSRNELLFSRFYDLLMANYRKHHELAWYAEQLCLSQKYFSLVIRQTTEHSAADWIDIVLLMQAKRLLRTRRDMTIQQISFELGFKEVASFCRFFKENTGLRPKEYRES